MSRVIRLLFVLLLASVLTAAAQQAAPPATHLKVGDHAPEFLLPDQDGKPVKLSDFAGKKNVVLAFYVLAFTGGWTKELQAYQADIAKFDETNSQILGISVDSYPANKQFANQLHLTFPLLSDFKREVSKKYGILDEENGWARRSTFVIDRNGVIQHIEQGRSAVDPSGAHTVCARLPKT